jgi:hypothetical protein
MVKTILVHISIVAPKKGLQNLNLNLNCWNFGEWIQNLSQVKDNPNHCNISITPLINKKINILIYSLLLKF